MAESDEHDGLERWARIMNKGHGYAGVFNHETSADKCLVELSTIEEWCVSIEAEYGIEVKALQPNPNDPPDFHADIAGQQLKIELVQLVEQDHKRRATKNETPFAGQLFKDTQWSKDRFISKLNDVIAAKGEKYKKVGLQIDVLLIHTAEPWLNSTQAQMWLTGAKVKSHPSIGTVSLLFRYEPGRKKDHWPTLMVYGDLPQNPTVG